jgi:hypothetical protein
MTILRLSEKSENELDQKLKDNEDTFDLCVSAERKRTYLIEGDSLAIIFAS